MLAHERLHLEDAWKRQTRILAVEKIYGFDHRPWPPVIVTSASTLILESAQALKTSRILAPELALRWRAMATGA